MTSVSMWGSNAQGVRSRPDRSVVLNPELLAVLMADRPMLDLVYGGPAGRGMEPSRTKPEAPKPVEPKPVDPKPEAPKPEASTPPPSGRPSLQLGPNRPRSKPSTTETGRALRGFLDGIEEGMKGIADSEFSSAGLRNPEVGGLGPRFVPSGAVFDPTVFRPPRGGTSDWVNGLSTEQKIGLALMVLSGGLGAAGGVGGAAAARGGAMLLPLVLGGAS